MGESRKIEGCFNKIVCGFQRCLKGFNVCFRKVFQGCFKEVVRVFQGRLKGVLMKLYVGFKGV